MGYRLTNRARRDVLGIWRYIAEDSEFAADRFIDRLTHHFRILGDAPYAGRARDEIHPGYHSFPVGEYLISTAFASRESKSCISFMDAWT